MTGEAPPKANDRMMGDPWQPLAIRDDLKAQYSFEFLRALDQALRLQIDERWRNAAEFKKALEGKSPKVVERLKENETVFPPLNIEPLPKSKKVAVWITGICLALCALGYGLWEAGKSEVQITSNPPGAEVVQNGIVIGRTPFSFDSLPPFSKWQLDLRLKGHESQVIQGSVTWRERTVAPVSQLKALPYKVIITSEPVGAEVFLGDKSLGVTPWESEPIEGVSEISYLLRTPGYNEQAVTAQLKAGESTRLEVRMERDKWHALNAGEDERLKMAEAGDAYAQALIGHDKYFGSKEGRTFDEIESLKKDGEAWIRKSAEQNHPLGLVVLGHFHHIQNSDPDKVEAAKMFYDKALKYGLITEHNQKDPCWSYYVGRFYEDGYGVSKDVNEAVKWYRKASEQGYALAQFTLGLCYENGVGLEKDSSEALKWICEAAEQGSAAAQLDLGMRCISGNGLEQNADEAVRWFTKAASQGLAYAQYQLGQCYHLGQGLEKNDVEAVKWYRKAAEQGLPSAQRELGVFYTKGDGVEKDETEAFKWYLKAAQQGEARAQHFLGLCYTNGRGVKKDDAEAFNWYRKAAEQGQPHAQNNLGACYADGIGVDKDAVEAARWYRKAADQGDSVAQYNIGLFYADGIGVDKNIVEAQKWFLKAAENGNADAQYVLGVENLFGENISLDVREAIKWLRKSAESGHANAQYLLGVCYGSGKGVEGNITKAYMWIALAAASGSERAKDDLKLIAKSLTRTQLTEAQRLVREWKSNAE
jgi:TPR repeat protein